MHRTNVTLKVPPDVGTKLERQIMEYNHLRELGESLGSRGLLDPTKLC